MMILLLAANNAKNTKQNENKECDKDKKD